MAVSQAPACGPASERSIAREAGGIEGNSTWWRKKRLLPSAASRRQAGACSPDRARSVHAAKAGLRANRLGEAQPAQVRGKEGDVSRRAGNVLGRLA